MHWLGMRFNTPFVNLAIKDKDFILMLEHWDEFLEYPIIEVRDHEKNYPVGKSILGIKLHFVHYKTFEEAMLKFEERKKRINQDNFGVLLSNWRGGLNELKRYENLPFKHKIILSPYDVDGSKTIVKIDGVNRMIGGLPYLEYKNIFGSRYVDQWNFVDWINSLSK